MRAAIAKGSREDAKEVMERVAASGMQVRGFYNKAFSEEEIVATRALKNGDVTPTMRTALAIGDSVEITLKSDYQDRKGEITDIGYGAKETDYYIQLEGEKVIVPIPVGSSDLVVFAHLRKL